MDKKSVSSIKSIIPVKVCTPYCKKIDVPRNAIWLGRGSKYYNVYLNGDRHITSRDEYEKALKAYRCFLNIHLKKDPSFLEPLYGQRLAYKCYVDGKITHVDLIIEKIIEMIYNGIIKCDS